MGEAAMKITVRYFAHLRERAGTETAELEWDDARPTLARFREHLAAATPALAPILRERPLLCAVNREYAGPDTMLRDGDEVALFPPVSGG
jgi:molybdopterin synthase sulfur carrier subunit